MSGNKILLLSDIVSITLYSPLYLHKLHCCALLMSESGMFYSLITINLSLAQSIQITGRCNICGNLVCGTECFPVLTYRIVRLVHKTAYGGITMHVRKSSYPSLLSLKQVCKIVMDGFMTRYKMRISFKTLIGPKLDPPIHLPS